MNRHRSARCAGAVAAALVWAARPGLAAPPPALDLADDAARGRSVASLQAWHGAARRAAEARAVREGWPLQWETPGGQVARLVGLRPDGAPRYRATCNAAAAISLATDLVRATAPYSVTGATLRIGIWDAGVPRLTHVELAGRIDVGDGTVAMHDHSTHVGGTLAAAGLNAALRGMAPAARLYSCDYANDTAEMAAVAATAPAQTNRLYLSNHSYIHLTGWHYNVGWRWYGTWGLPEADEFGQYNSYARLLDDLVDNAPYYLPVQAAGNDRDDGTPGAYGAFTYWSGTAWVSTNYIPGVHPGGDGVVNAGYDTLPDTANAKNILTIGAVQDAVSGGQRWLGGAVMEVYSAWGPTDDGRIKPDLVANGYWLRSCLAAHDTAYGDLAGTSTSSPNACGSLALLQELAGSRVPGGALRASALKALAIHTADDLGRPGPDYSFGWGLINTRAAADLLLARAAGAAAVWMGDAAVDATTRTRTWELTISGTNLLQATLAWTDPPGAATTAFDSPTSRLVNDLDLRLLAAGGSVARYPWILDPATPGANATPGDNTRDNIEQLPAAAAAAGTYRLRVSSKNSPAAAQTFSLLCTGQAAARLVTNDLAEAVDQPGAGFAGGGDEAMAYQESVTRDGFDAARSAGGLHANEASWMETVVQGPRRVSFWWKVSSEAGGDVGSFLIGGVTQAAISGEVDWHQRQFVLPEGTHTLRWQYAKDPHGVAGSDALFVDQVVCAARPDPGTVLVIR